MQLSPSAHADTFCRDNLPAPGQWPDLEFTLPELVYPGPAQRRRRAAEPDDRGRRRRPALPALAGGDLDLRRRGQARRPDRRGAHRGSWPGARQPGTAARARTTRGWRRAGSACSRPAASRWPRCRCCAPPSSPASATSRRSGSPCAITGSPPTCARRPFPDLRIVEFGGADPGDLTQLAAVQAGRVRLGPDGRRRRGDDRLHVRHDRQAEGRHALPPRPARGGRHVLRARAEARAGRPVRRDAAAGVHFRPRRAAAVPAAGRRGHPAAGEGDPGRTGRRHRRARRDRAVHRADRVPGDARGGQGRPAARPAQARCRRARTCRSRPGRRSTTPPA